MDDIIDFELDRPVGPVEVPDPVWNMSRTNWPSNPPTMTSSAARRIAAAFFSSRWPCPAAISAADPLIRPRAEMKPRPKRCDEIGKLSTARWVEAP